MSSSVPVNQLESSYVLDGRVHVTHYTYACVAISCLCGFLSAVFLPGYFAIIGIIVPPLIHGVLIAAVWQRWIHVLQTGLALDRMSCYRIGSIETWKLET
ncbi:hypothetical protein M3Y98_01222900 [Aphelenchoides besseyi]|nr:hypothetical protein M3Y98_01222900 [Aphelenchoides besseyi]